MIYSILIGAFAVVLMGTTIATQAQKLYELPADHETRWSSFENRSAAKGSGGIENRGAKGHPSETIRPGETKVLLDVNGAGIVQRIWLTLQDRSAAALRSLVIEMYWDGAAAPAVSVPLGDFFGVGLGRMVAFENALFADPEGRSFNCYIPMPYRNGARIAIRNESAGPNTLYYDVSFQQVKSHPAEVMYFHAFWSRSRKSEPGTDYPILPAVKGSGRYLGMNMGIITDTAYQKSWWGEGEVKIYLDGDEKFPTLNGTGTEDYIGTGWGQGAFTHTYQGCLVADENARQWTFYRYHVPDPVYFRRDCKVTIQLMGGDHLQKVREYKKNGARLVPVTISSDKGLFKFFEQDPVPDLTDEKLPAGWTNFYRSDDVSATAYFYLNKPVHDLPALPPAEERAAGLR